MIWDDAGFLLSKNRYNENSLIAEIYTENHGKVSGIIFGGTSKKIKNYLQIGNKLHLDYTSKSISKIGYFKIEILNAYSPLYFENKKKLSCISSSMYLIKLLTAEAQKNNQIFFLIDTFFDILKLNDWIKRYIFWELEFFKLLGYDLELKNIVKKEKIDNKMYYFVESTSEKKIVPNFLIEKDIDIVDDKNLLNGLKLLSDYLEKSILKPNNINYPSSRQYFVNLLK